jgi:hypothetical protein
MKCPLCSRECLQDYNRDSYYCPTTVVIEWAGNIRLTHFETYVFETRRGSGRKDTVIIPPYKIENYSDPETPSEIFPFTDISILNEDQAFYMMEARKLIFKRILEVPLVHLDTEERLRERIKLLLVLS